MNRLNNDTICAISTPPGVGGIAIIRISGPQALKIADSVWEGSSLTECKARTAHFGSIIDSTHDGELLDQAIATLFHSPASFTGEDVVEFSVHGSKYVQRTLLQLLISKGCRLADPGEFTRRAFANGKLDLAQAEAVADVIASNSRAAHRLAASQMKGDFSRRLESLRSQLLDLASLLELELDFSDEEVEFADRTQLSKLATQIHDEVTRLYQSFSVGKVIKEGIPVAIVGPTNAGKSSLLNLLLGDNRAIVSDIHGTTRDTIEDTLEIGDYLFRLIDTAGIRNTSDPIEAMGIDRSRQAMHRAAIRIAVIDSTAPFPDASFIDQLAKETADRSDDTNAPNPNSSPLIILLNKSDLGADLQPLNRQLSAIFPDASIFPFSTKNANGLSKLQDTLTHIADTMRGQANEDTIMVTNLRHSEALREAAESSRAVQTALATHLSGDLIAQDLRATISALSTITGTITTPEILSSIFSRFCIGK